MVQSRMVRLFCRNWKQGDEDGDVRRGKKFEEEFVSLMMILEKERRSLLAEKRGKKVQS